MGSHVMLKSLKKKNSHDSVSSNKKVREKKKTSILFKPKVKVYVFYSTASASGLRTLNLDEVYHDIIVFHALYFILCLPSTRAVTP